MSNGARPAPKAWFEEDLRRKHEEITGISEVSPRAEPCVREDGLFGVTAEVTYEGQSLEVEIVFPAGFPFVAPTIYGPPRLLWRHQTPRGNFCLLDNEEHRWKPHHHAATLLVELQRMLEAAERGELEEGELDIAEPLTGYLNFLPSLAVLVSEEMLVDDLGATGGRFQLIQRGDLQFVLTQVSNASGETLAEFPQELARRIRLGEKQGQRVRGTWVAIQDKLDVRQIAEIGAAARQELGRQAAAGGKRGRVLWTGITFIEQGPDRERERRSWVFYQARTGRHGGIADEGLPIRTLAVSEATRADRLLELRGLSDRRFLVVGAGAIGGPLVAELAKAGVGQIDVADPDFYDPGNSVRHVLPLESAGLPKATQLESLGRDLNPFSDVHGHVSRFGSDPASLKNLDDLIREADVVIDATGMHSVTRLLHQHCVDAGGRPLVSAALSVGGHGGRIVVLRDRSPCFDCFREDPEVARPDRGEMQNRTPYGCSHPAASCAGFDALEIVTNTARTAVRLVEDIGYPDLDFDWAVINFRPNHERWQQGELTPQPKCAWCR